MNVRRAEPHQPQILNRTNKSQFYILDLLRSLSNIFSNVVNLCQRTKIRHIIHYIRVTVWLRVVVLVGGARRWQQFSKRLKWIYGRLPCRRVKRHTELIATKPMGKLWILASTTGPSEQIELNCPRVECCELTLRVSKLTEFHEICINPNSCCGRSPRRMLIYKLTHFQFDILAADRAPTPPPSPSLPPPSFANLLTAEASRSRPKTISRVLTSLSASITTAYADFRHAKC